MAVDRLNSEGGFNKKIRYLDQGHFLVFKLACLRVEKK